MAPRRSRAHFLPLGSRIGVFGVCLGE